MRYLFGTDGLRGLANEYPLIPEAITQIARAAVRVLRGKPGDSFIIGKDTRRSCDMLEAAVTAGVCAAGLVAVRAGVLPTPGVARLGVELGCIGGAMISASHNRAPDNGVKFFDWNGYKLLDRAEEEIEKAALTPWDGPVHTGTQTGIATDIPDATRRYVDSLKACARPGGYPGLRVVVDCANGAAYRAAPLLFGELGTEVVALYAQPDGLNINLGCGVEHVQEVAREVVARGADVGIAVDGDGDRLIMVDEQGHMLDGDQLLAACALYQLERGRLPGNAVVGTEMTNSGLDIALAAAGAQVVRTRVGDRYVVEEMVKQGLKIGGEQSGHLIFLNHGTTADALLSAIMVLNVLAARGGRLSQFQTIMTRLPQVLINIPVVDKPEFWEIESIRNAIQIAQRRLEGCGRISVRYSGTENLARVMVESTDEGLSQQCADLVANAFRVVIGA